MGIQGKDVSLYLSGCNVPIPDCNIILTQPTIRQIMAFGEDQFFLAVRSISDIGMVKDSVMEGNPELETLSDFQILLIILLQDPMFKKTMDRFFELVFPIYSVEVTDTEIFFKEKESKVIKGRITPFNLSNLQTVLKNIFEPYNNQKNSYNPQGDKAKEIAKKLEEGARKRAALQGKSDTSSSLFGLYISILSIGLQMDMNILLNYTPFQLYDLFERYMAKSAYDFYRQVSTTPFMDVSKMETPEEWVRNLYD